MKRLPVDFNFFDKKALSEIECIEIKYKEVRDFQHLHQLSSKFHPSIRNVITCMNNWSLDYFDKYEKCYITVKVRDLKAGDSGDVLNSWHYDWVKDKDHHNKEETHLLYTNKYGTHYIEDDVEKQCEDNSIYKYNREIHKSPIVPEDIKRVMIRLSFVDKLNLNP